MGGVGVESVEKSILQMPSTISMLLVKDIEQLHTKKEKNWFKLKYNSQEMSRQEITKAFSFLLTAHPRHGSIPRQHTLLCLKPPKNKVLQSYKQITFFFTLCNFIYFLI